MIPGLGRSPGEGNGNPRQYSCLENSMDSEACVLQSVGPQKSQTQLIKKNKVFPLYTLSTMSNGVTTFISTTKKLMS